MPIKFRIRLTPQEREQLMNVLRKKRCAAARQSHARILLKADEDAGAGGLLDADIAAAVEVSIATVERVRRRFVDHGLESALERKAPDREYERRLDGTAGIVERKPVPALQDRITCSVFAAHRQRSPSSEPPRDSGMGVLDHGHVGDA